MRTIEPLFIALTGARDRAKHEGKPVGVVGCRANVDIHMCVITDAPHEIKDRVERLQIATMRIIEQALQIMANDVSSMTGCHVPASVTVKPHSITALTTETDNDLAEARRIFLEAAQRDTKAMDALATVTAQMVEHWEG